jgi:hypothetical protein
MSDEPNPGSKEAIARGCTCPVIDNHHGKGIPSKDGPVFWYTVGCPIHHPTPPKAATS